MRIYAREVFSEFCATNPFPIPQTTSLDRLRSFLEAIGREPDRPAKFMGIEALPKRVTRMAADVDAIKAYIAQHCT